MSEATAKSSKRSPMLDEVLRGLEAERQRLQMTQVEFCGKGGVSDQTWQYWMSGATVPKWDTLERIMLAHGLHLSFAQPSDHVRLSDQTKEIVVLLELMPADLRGRAKEKVAELLREALQRTK